MEEEVAEEMTESHVVGDYMEVAVAELVKKTLVL